MDYISRDDAVNAAAEDNPAKRMINLCKIPSQDVRPVIHSKWYYDPDGMDWGLGAWKCEHCHCRNDNLPANIGRTNPLNWAGSNYCPNCGADMRYA